MVRASIKKSVGPSGDDDMDLSIWQQTLEEVKLGWLKRSTSRKWGAIVSAHLEEVRGEAKEQISSSWRF